MLEGGGSSATSVARERLVVCFSVGSVSAWGATVFVSTGLFTTGFWVATLGGAALGKRAFGVTAGGRALGAGRREDPEANAA